MWQATCSWSPCWLSAASPVVFRCHHGGHSGLIPRGWGHDQWVSVRILPFGTSWWCILWKYESVGLVIPGISGRKKMFQTTNQIHINLYESRIHINPYLSIFIHIYPQYFRFGWAKIACHFCGSIPSRVWKRGWLERRPPKKLGVVWESCVLKKYVEFTGICWFP